MKTNLSVFTLCVALLAQVAAAQQRGRAYPPKFEAATVETYKTAGEVKLTMSVFSPAGHKASERRPAIVFFFGGGFVGGSPAQFHQHCRSAIMGKKSIDRTNPDGSPAFPQAIMPWHHIREDLPPSIMFFGTDDRLIEGAKEFRQAAGSKGNRCELVTWEGVGHGFFNLGRGGNKHFVETLKAADKFLASLGYVKGEPTVDAFVAKQINGN